MESKAVFFFFVAQVACLFVSWLFNRHPDVLSMHRLQNKVFFSAKGSHIISITTTTATIYSRILA